MIRGGRIDGQGADALIHAAVYAAAARLGRLDDAASLGGSVEVLIDRGKGRGRLRGRETRGGLSGG